MISRLRAALGGPLISHIPSSPGGALSGPALGFLLFDPSLAQDSFCQDTFVTVPSPKAVFQITSDLPECQQHSSNGAELPE